jgi:hypothetical protein
LTARLRNSSARHLPSLEIGFAGSEQVLDEGHGFSRVPMSLRLTQGDENGGESYFRARFPWAEVVSALEQLRP